MKYEDEIKLLRTHLPVGIKYAEKLLIESAGDIDLAQQIFKTHIIDLLIQKTSVNKKQAEQYLKMSNYDLGQAVLLYEKEKYTVAELCLLKYKDKREALDKLLLSIEQQHNQSFWLCWQNTSTITMLNEPQYNFVVLMEWIEYEEWEGDIIINEEIAELWKKLDVDWLVILLENVLRKIEDLKETNTKYWEYDVYKILNKTFNERQIELIDCLYEYVQDNIKFF